MITLSTALLLTAVGSAPFMYVGANIATIHDREKLVWFLISAPVALLVVAAATRMAGA